MSTTTFDTHRFIRKLKDAGISEQQAEALTEAFRDAQGETDFATKKDIQLELAPLKADMALVKWMLGIVIGGIIAIILKTFFPA